jgi:hypothetical protein
VSISQQVAAILVYSKMGMRIIAGGDHTCAISDMERTICWGSDSSGESGNGIGSMTSNIPTAIDASNLEVGEYFVVISAYISSSCGVSNLGNDYC